MNVIGIFYVQYIVPTFIKDKLNYESIFMVLNDG